MPLLVVSVCLLINIAMAALANWSNLTVACLLVTFCAWLFCLATTAAELSRR